MRRLVLYSIALSVLIFSVHTSVKADDDNLPVSSRWVLEAVNEVSRHTVKAVYFVLNKRTQKKGTAFLLKNGPLITNEHVVRGCLPTDIELKTISGTLLAVTNIVVDVQRDLAALYPSSQLKGGLELSLEKDPPIGTKVRTWGFPLGYNGPAPLLSVGYLSGYSASPRRDKKGVVKHYVVNGAFNPGNSGGPLFVSTEQKVIGVVVSKHAPISNFVKTGIKSMEKNTNVAFGAMRYLATDTKGKSRPFSESEVVARILKEYRDLSQVMIGEAITVTELRAFLNEKKISY